MKWGKISWLFEALEIEHAYEGYDHEWAIATPKFLDKLPIFRDYSLILLRRKKPEISLDTPTRP